MMMTFAAEKTLGLTCWRLTSSEVAITVFRPTTLSEKGCHDDHDDDHYYDDAHNHYDDDISGDQHSVQSRSWPLTFTFDLFFIFFSLILSLIYLLYFFFDFIFFLRFYI